MSSNDFRKPRAPSARDSAVRAAKRKLKGEILRRCLVCGGAVFVVTLVLSGGPFPFGPNYPFAALVGMAAAAVSGLALAAFVYFEIHRFRAQSEGSTLSYRLGRWLRKSVTRAVRR